MSSRTAQQRLAQLEKTDAPFQEQLDEAAKFIGLDAPALQNLDEPAPKNFYGKEEWVLRWLLKKLQSSEGKNVRLNALSWQLLHHVIRIIPIPNVARSLNDKKFLTILSQTLEDTKEQDSLANHQFDEAELEASTHKKSRKRKRSGDDVADIQNSSTGELREAIVKTLSYLSNPPEALTTTSDTSRSTIASAEFSQSVLRTTADEAAKILGLWLLLCRKYFPSQDASSCLVPFVQIWASRKIAVEPFLEFSLHCTKPLLRLLLDMSEGTVTQDFSERNRSWKPELERLLAFNVIVPARFATTDTRQKLIDAHVLEDASLAPIIFETAIRCVSTRGGYARSDNDASWLQTLFDCLQTAINPSKQSETSPSVKSDTSKAYASLNSMISAAISNKTKIDLKVLCAAVSGYGLLDADQLGINEWKLVAALITLDSNIFLSSQGKTSSPNLLEQLLSHITLAAFLDNWADVAQTVIEDVTVPLMKEFAKARNLTGFMKHWNTQMKKFILKCNEATDSVARFCAWEDDALQKALRDNMEASLTMDQIVQLVDWIESELHVDGSASVPAACVLLQALSNSIGVEITETTQVLPRRLADMLLTPDVSKNFLALENRRYSWRKWCILTNILTTADFPSKDIVEIWSAWSDELKLCVKKARKEGIDNMESFHALQCLFAFWDFISRLQADDQLEVPTSIADLSTKAVEYIDKYLVNFITELEDKYNSIHTEPSTRESATLLSRGAGWYANAYTACILTQFPTVLELVPNLKLSRQEIILKILQIASYQPFEPSTLWAEDVNRNQFPCHWNAAIRILLKNYEVLCKRNVMPRLIDAMLQCTTMKTSPNSESDCNIFVAECLSGLVTMGAYEIFTRKQRELIMKAWAPKAVTQSYFNPNIWFLKYNTMKVHTFYDGMTFQHLVEMADTLRSSDVPSSSIPTLVHVFGDLVTRIMGHVISSLDSELSQRYLMEVTSFLKEYSKAQIPTSFVLGSLSSIPGAIRFTHGNLKLVDRVLQSLTSDAATKKLNKMKLDHPQEFKDLSSRAKLAKVKVEFKKALLSDLKFVLNFVETGGSQYRADGGLFLDCVLDALEHLDTTEDDLVPILEDILSFLISHQGASEVQMPRDSMWRLTAFAFVHAPKACERLPMVAGNLDTAVARVELRRIIEAKASRLDPSSRVQMAQEFAQSLADEELEENQRIAKLYALEYTLTSCYGNDVEFPGLPIVYSMTAEIMSKSRTHRELRLTSRMLAKVLRTKGHVIVQQNVDSILSAITIICSRNGPSINQNHAGTIFSCLCDLLQAILANRNHRRQIQGHFHILLQAMQALMTCLFTPSEAASSSKFNRSNPLPPWVRSPSHPKHHNHLQSKHAEQYTRLVTLICDPSSSLVSDKKTSDLNDAKSSAKRNAGEHMIYLLTYYIKLQSEMKLSHDMREHLKPAVWALMNSTDSEIRSRTVLELEDKDRPIWNQLWKDWGREGKFRGN